MAQAQILQGVGSYLDDCDNIVCSGYQRARWEGKSIVGLFKNMSIIRRATKLASGGHPMAER